ncbi:16S rRNA (cytidine(1402)-2'-O)-methyltransferase [Enterococcus hulanensis]|uniref:Ribosomal RNA small subunit methyltransferase I n=1 Tax=Enterococcus hulanensis TaxID=2559929 RepID=A0ABU3F010_9ENTE|nr:16S rRNA (cytidine(1402)-2'-O)-methyltransferase [Enterococcus hulanensis]MDT2600470.1 16S rRNA (cytidine(1402)-2'-O)-methyltransferase [Enterococcus hulanensis]MDT2609792.1 16S rRNA (cytidine(1402)-2'-O)-methyltransferase [Enterococcus hulanensis]MDT2617580.1 16S rRNA (cytidine(1402)-2'-O)-methyltransferase [Enterococcus hulanensis]MDT2628805.1 16S rRNA (cytidine(1402)-2'-O)-methyltransferase [Enterococcus hulanensis]MDT2656145.1 16S rRNA (cytidine(1402)-2'-O)-methyltransferase [Enterococc
MIVKIQKSFAQQVGTLYLVPTPIGNLEDMTFRAVKTLQTVDLIASEDTRNTQKLLNHFEVKVPQKSLHEHNYNERIPELLDFLESGKSIAQVSDAGMPSISDPGHELVVACIEKDIPVVSLPGATAGMTALIASGLLPQPFFFYGFLQRKRSVQKKELDELKGQSATLIFYESPHRIKETLKNILEVFGNREVVICRELTKLYEEYLRGTAEELIEYLSEHSLKGECCLLVSGATETAEEEIFTGTLKEQVEEMISGGTSSKEAIKSVAKRHGLKKQDVYKEYHEL